MAVVQRQRASGFAGAGLGLAVLSAGTFGTSGTFADSLIKAGWSPAAAVTVRISLSALFLTIPALISLRGRWALLRRDGRRVAAYGLIAVAGSSCSTSTRCRAFRLAWPCCSNTSARCWWWAGCGCGTGNGRAG